MRWGAGRRYAVLHEEIAERRGRETERDRDEGNGRIAAVWGGK